MSKSIPEDFGVGNARAFKVNLDDEHAPWYVALPNGNLMKLGFHADDSVDKAQAEFIADAINQAMKNASPACPPAPPSVALRALYTWADEEEGQP